MGTRIFVSCAAVDKPRAEEVCKKFAASGLNIEIAGLSDVDEREFEDGIESSRFALVFFSNQSKSESEKLGEHLEIALRSAGKLSSDRVFIIPARLDKCEVPESVDHLQLIDLFKEEGFDQIVEVIRGELSLFTDDRDGQVYKTVDIAGCTWLRENLNYEVTDSWWYDDEPANGKRFGRLYTWEAALAACPAGWRIPTVADWEHLAASAGGTWDFVESASAYTALTEGACGFRAMLGGLRERAPFDAFYERGQTGIYWGGNAESGIFKFLFGGKTGRLASFEADKLDEGYSCRLVRNA